MMKRILLLLIFSILTVNSFSQSRVDTYYSSLNVVGGQEFNGNSYILFQYNNYDLIAVSLIAEGTSDMENVILYSLQDTYEKIQTDYGVMNIYNCKPLNSLTKSIDGRYAAIDPDYKFFTFIVPDKSVQIFRLDRLESRKYD